MSYKKQNIVVIGNLNYRNEVDVTVKIPHFSNSNSVIPLKIEGIPIVKNNTFKIPLNPGETQVLIINDLEIK